MFSSVPGRTSGSMPRPTGLPWNANDVSWGTQSPPDLVEFTANSKAAPAHAIKRKLHFETRTPAKQSRTDEFMAAHLRGLHISPEFKTHASPSDFCDDVEDEDASEYTFQNPVRVEALRRGDRIVLCEEMRKLQSEPIIPHSIMDKLEKPCMSLMLWKPPERMRRSESPEKKFPEAVLVQRYSDMEL